ncbi:glycosyltransferase [Geofilum rubicundum JCM 15548]|uniref:Glycosyltransferase n=1 Tax=Geofilum rubicundum JCM 15548 TaxID=1236989 RepID=A0A0E9LZD0_9BACT|nr:glycosyltransferase [Geofilum rubicundum JCM 15548]
MSNLKIVVVSNMFPTGKQPRYGIFVKEWLDQLKNDCTFKISSVLIRGRGTNIIAKLAKYFVFYLRILWVLGDSNALFYFHFGNHSLLPLLFYRKRVLKRVIVNFHGSDLFPGRWAGKFLLRITSTFFSHIGAFVVPSADYGRTFAENYGISSEQIFVSPSGGVDSLVFQPNGEIQSDVVHIGFVGRLDPGKGFDTLINGFSLLIEKYEQLHLHVVGCGSLEEIYRTKVNNSKKLKEHVTFYGEKPRSQLTDFYNHFDIFVFPSLRESLGLVGLEAMACGTPVIGSRIDGISSYLKDEVNGIAFEAGNALDLCNSVEKYIGLSMEEKIRMRGCALQTATCYDKNNVMLKMKYFIKEVWKRNT